MSNTKPMAYIARTRGMTLIELVIVVAILGILMALAVPGYNRYILRVHRTEAIRMLLQASMCQERIYASQGRYDTSQCQPIAQQRYQIAYTPADTQGRTYIAMATPQGAQLADPCGSLSLDQNGKRDVIGTEVTTTKVSAVRCWNGR